MDYIIYGLYCKDDPLRKIRYVGQTSQDLETRFRGHKSAWTKGASKHLPVSRWVKKHLKCAGIKELDRGGSTEHLNSLEILWIEQEGTHVTQVGGLNVSLGGGGRRGHTFKRKPQTKGPKLTTSEVEEIKRLIWEGHSNQEISTRYPVNNRSVGNIARGETWRHVPWPEDLGLASILTSRESSPGRCG